MLIDYPVYFDETIIITPDKWDEERTVLENAFQSEAGTDIISVTRYGKLKVSASFSCSDRWAAIFTEFSEQDSILVKLFDVRKKGYAIHLMRIRNYHQSIVPGSERTEGTNGLYSVSFDLEEF